MGGKISAQIFFHQVSSLSLSNFNEYLSLNSKTAHGLLKSKLNCVKIKRISKLLIVSK